MSWSKSHESEHIPSTGVVTGYYHNYDDSVLVSVEDLRTVVIKLIDLKYEKQINNSLKEVIKNDSIIIREDSIRYSMANTRYKESIKKVKRERNILGGVSIGTFILLVLSLL